MKIFKPVVFIFALAVLGGCTITNQYGPYYGKIVDAETKEPIEGAAVLIVFHTVSATVGGAVYHYADAAETVTNKKGEFNIPARRLVSPGVLKRWDEYGHVAIFKPGYGCYPDHKDAKPMFVPNGTIPGGEHVEFELPKLETRRERIESTHCAPSLDIPYIKAKKFIDLVNVENKSLGIGEEKYR